MSNHLYCRMFGKPLAAANTGDYLKPFNYRRSKPEVLRADFRVETVRHIPGKGRLVTAKNSMGDYRSFYAEEAVTAAAGVPA